MNRKECEEALQFLKENAMELVDDEDMEGNMVYEYKNYSEYDLKVYVEPLEKLIQEHFDNPPLKFEELEEGMWIWDNWVKRWIKVHYTPEEVKNRNLFCTSENDDLMEFDKNRFYRKQVE